MRIKIRSKQKCRYQVFRLFLKVQDVRGSQLVSKQQRRATVQCPLNTDSPLSPFGYLHLPEEHTLRVSANKTEGAAWCAAGLGKRAGTEPDSPLRPFGYLHLPEDHSQDHAACYLQKGRARPDLVSQHSREHTFACVCRDGALLPSKHPHSDAEPGIASESCRVPWVLSSQVLISICCVHLQHRARCARTTPPALGDLQPVKKLPCAVPDFVTFTSGHFETSHKKTARNSSGNTGLNISYTPSLFHLLTSYTPTSFDIRHSHRAKKKAFSDIFTRNSEQHDFCLPKINGMIRSSARLKEELEGVQNQAKTDIPANTRCKHVIPAQKFTPLLRTGVRAQAGPRWDAKRGLATHRLPLPVENRQRPRACHTQYAIKKAAKQLFERSQKAESAARHAWNKYDRLKSALPCVLNSSKEIERLARTKFATQPQVPMYLNSHYLLKEVSLLVKIFLGFKAFDCIIIGTINPQETAKPKLVYSKRNVMTKSRMGFHCQSFPFRYHRRFAGLQRWIPWQPLTSSFRRLWPHAADSIPSRLKKSRQAPPNGCESGHSQVGKQGEMSVAKVGASHSPLPVQAGPVGHAKGLDKQTGTDLPGAQQFLWYTASPAPVPVPLGSRVRLLKLAGTNTLAKLSFALRVVSCLQRAFSKRLPHYETLRIPAMHISAACCTQNIWEEEEENKLIIYKIIAGFVVVRLSAVYKNNLFATSVQRGCNLVVIVSVKTTILQFNSDVWLFSSSSVAPQAVFVTTGVTVGFTVQDFHS
ncbi:hypothetical protein Anapl_03523 [Anas platyrhynchos]|uniref:Uncharacterized protein n=1 Tax=Anas platyrhynchos TaxID=8839 RepID=R0K4S7_ANAPL|nr:hypothetical protein Anapl_03523 [Anas platyrhynchos]